MRRWRSAEWSATAFLAVVALVAPGCSSASGSSLPSNDGGRGGDDGDSAAPTAAGDDAGSVDGALDGSSCWAPQAAYFHPTNVVIGDCSYHFNPPTKMDVSLGDQRAVRVILGPTDATTFRGTLACDGPSTLTEDPDTTPGNVVTGTMTLSPTGDGMVSVSLVTTGTVHSVTQNCSATFSMSWP